MNVASRGSPALRPDQPGDQHEDQMPMCRARFVSSGAKDHFECSVLRQTAHLPDATIRFPEDNRRGPREAKLGHQSGIVLELFCHCGADRFQRDYAAVPVLMFVFSQRLLRRLGLKNGSRLGWGILSDHADHDMSELYLARLDPGPGSRPELVAIGAVGIRKHVNGPRRVRTSILYPRRPLQLFPERKSTRLNSSH